MKLKIVCIESELNKYSFNALVGALETKGLLEKISVNFINLKEVQNKLSFLRELAENSDKILIAFSYFTPQVWEVEKTLKFIKNSLKGCGLKKLLFVAGGPHPTGEPVTTLLKGFDYVFVGEAEQSFPEFVKAILNNEDFSKVKGLAYFENEKFVFTGKPPYVSLDRFLPFSIRLKRISPLEITRGCPFGCFYCQTSRIFGKEVRHRSLDVILKITEDLLKIGFRDMRFISPDAFSYGSEDGKKLNLKALEELLRSLYKLVKSYGGRIFFGSFPSEVRPDHVIEETAILVKKYASNDNLVIGAQSGSERILKLCRRGHTVEDVFQAVKICKKVGLIPKVDFIFGLPGEKEEDVKETVKVMEELTKMGAKIHAHTFMPLPQTPFAKEKPGKIHPEVLKAINRLIGKGLLFGEWKKQELLAEKIYHYLKNCRKLKTKKF